MSDLFLAVGGAAWLGVLTAVSPCLMACNVAAITFIARRVGNPKHALLSGLFYVAAWERAAKNPETIFPNEAYGAVRAFDPLTGDKKWEFKIEDAVFWRGVLTTASDLLFTGTSGDFYSDRARWPLVNGYFYALDARTGEVLWKFGLTDSVQSPPMTYAIGDKQFVAVASEDTLFVFALRQ